MPRGSLPGAHAGRSWRAIGLAASFLGMIGGGCAGADQRVASGGLEAGTEIGSALIYRGAVVVDGLHAELGGISAIDVSGDGGQLLALSDTGRWFDLSLAYDPAGSLTGAALTDHGTLVGVDGDRLAGKSRADAEAVARLADGSYVVAFERFHRLRRYDGVAPLARTPEAIEMPAAVAERPANRGIEAITALPDGNLLLLAEEAGAGPNPRGQAWVGQEGAWTARDYIPADGFSPVGAATLPDGDVVVVERRLSFFSGFTTRLVRVAGADLTGESPIATTEIALIQAPLFSENFEAIAARQDREGRTFLYLASDDNRTAALRTVIALFELSG